MRTDGNGSATAVGGDATVHNDNSTIVQVAVPSAVLPLGVFYDPDRRQVIVELPPQALAAGDEEGPR